MLAVLLVAAALGMSKVALFVWQTGRSPPVIPFVTFQLLPLGFSLVTSWALIRRKPYARGLGLLFILGLLALLAFMSVEGFMASKDELEAAALHSASPPTTISELEGHVFGARVAGPLFFVLAGLWFVRFGFTRKAKAFFGVAGSAE
jgi:hypothetical protein